MLPSDRPAAGRLTPDALQAVQHNIKVKTGREVDAAFVSETFQVLLCLRVCVFATCRSLLCFRPGAAQNALFSAGATVGQLLRVAFWPA
jgi:hypothetical protein